MESQTKGLKFQHKNEIAPSETGLYLQIQFAAPSIEISLFLVCAGFLSFWGGVGVVPWLLCMVVCRLLEQPCCVWVGAV